MPYFARVDENDFFQEWIDFDPTGHFVASLIWREITNPAILEWINPGVKILENGTIEADLDLIKDAIKDRVSGIRFVEENNTLDYNGNSFWIDRSALSAIKSARDAVAAGDITSPVLWKCKKSWAELTEADFNALISLIAAHKQKCFKAEKLCHDTIDSFTTIEELTAVLPYDMWNEKIASL